MVPVASSLRLLTLILIAAIVAGCAGDEDEPLLVESALPRLVLQPADLPPPWIRFDEGRQLRADALPGDRADATRFGRKSGWKARYRRPGSEATRGPLVVESRADLFAATSGAEQDFEAAVADLEGRGIPTRPPGSVELGDDARVLSTGGSEPGQLATVTIVWRDQNIVATVTANGFSGKLTPTDVIALARKQQQRLQRALG